MSDDIMKPLEAMKLHTIQGIKGTSTMDQAAYDDAMKLLAQRQADGRYTLEEAAMAVNKATGARADEMLVKFIRAALAGVLRTYEPGKDSQYIYGEGFASCVRDFYEEAFWDDLNAWLEANENRITWRFPEPASQNKTGDSPQVGAGGAAKTKWVKQARDKGEEWMLAQEKSTDKRPTVEQIAKHLEGELSTQGITGARGKFLDWETIKREALTGITGRKRGDNFRNAKGNPHRK